MVTHDLLVLWDTQTRLELDAAHMAAAGVEFLPGAPARATIAAAHSAALCGLSPSEVVRAGAASDRMSFNVTVRRTAPVLLLRLLGVAGVNVTALATAKVRPSTTPRNSGGPMVLSAWSSVCRHCACARPRGRFDALWRDQGLARCFETVKKAFSPTRRCGGKHPDFWPA